MAVYPFYVNVKSSTRKSEIGVGARRKNSEMTIEVHQRDRGVITTPYRIKQETYENTETGVIHLVTYVYKNGELIDTHETEY